MNKSEFIQNAIGSIFDVISIAGWVIGGFSILVGVFEATFLSLIGGLAGLGLVLLLTFIPMGSLEVGMSFKNIMLGVGLSSVIGIASGIVPATLAARMDPVEAIRTT